MHYLTIYSYIMVSVYLLSIRLEKLTSAVGLWPVKSRCENHSKCIPQVCCAVGVTTFNLGIHHTT